MLKIFMNLQAYSIGLLNFNFTVIKTHTNKFLSSFLLSFFISHTYYQLTL